MNKHFLVQIVLVVPLIISSPLTAGAGEPIKWTDPVMKKCQSNWNYPTFHMLNMDGVTITLQKYANFERHYTLYYGDRNVDIFYLTDAILVKGFSAEEINKQITKTSRFPLPILFSMAPAALSQALSNGPCSIATRVPFSNISSNGFVEPVSPGVLAYEYNAKVDSPAASWAYEYPVGVDPSAKERKTVKFTGRLKFSVEEAKPPNNIDVKGYVIIPTGDQMKPPFPVAGDSIFPGTTIGQVKRTLITKMGGAGGGLDYWHAAFYGWQASERARKDDKSAVVTPQKIIFASGWKRDKKNPTEIFPLRFGEEETPYGFVDLSGQVVMEPQFTMIEDFHDDIAVVMDKNFLWGYVEKTGWVVGELQFHRGDMRGGLGFHNGLALADKGEQKGYIDRTGLFAIAPRFSDARPFSDEVAYADKAVIDKSGLILFKFPRQPERIGDFSEGLAYLWEKTNEGNSFGYIDKTGKYVIRFDKYLFGSPFSEGLAMVMTNERKYGFADKSGRLVVEPQFEKAESFRNGLAAVKKDGKWGFIDRIGQYVVTPQFEAAHDFHEDRAFVVKDQKVGYIDKSGQLAIASVFDRVVGAFTGSLTVKDFSEGMVAVRKGGKWGYLDRNGRVIVDFQFDWADNFKRGVARVSKNENECYIDKTGKFLVRIDTVCGQTIVMDGNGRITWPRDIKAKCPETK